MEITVLNCKKRCFSPEFSIFILISLSVANERDKRKGLEEREEDDLGEEDEEEEKTQIFFLSLSSNPSLLSLSFATDDDIEINIENSAKKRLFAFSTVNSITKYHSINYNRIMVCN